ncbi:VOC family protein [Azohydromonas aeria]|uniref:VOC family protein n=1 Tax=Azohydromonas aeria TaxID=2590212 RepID=UPI001E4C0900|nr:VOC family protein [Azohydromonas aeria]
MLPENCRVEPPKGRSLVKPFCLSHGTLECYSLAASRRFYEEFLGLEVVRHASPSMAVRLGMRFHIICVEVGDQLKPVHLLNHWGVDVATRAEVDEAYANALQHKEEYGIRQVTKPLDQHGVYSFYLVDLDHNWWEIQHYENGFLHDDYFDFGDRFSMQDGHCHGREDEVLPRVEVL